MVAELTAQLREELNREARLRALLEGLHDATRRRFAYRPSVLVARLWAQAAVKAVWEGASTIER